MEENMEMMDQIDLKQLWGMLKSNFLLILNITLVAMIIAALFSFVILDKQYESYTTLLLGRPIDYQGSTSGEITSADINLNRQLVSTYSEIAKSRAVTSQVITNLNLDLSDGALASMISVNTVNDTEIIRMTVRSTDPILSASIANEMAETFSTYVSDLMRIDNINVIDVAQASNIPVAPRSSMNIAIAMVLGLMIGVFVSLLKEYLDTRLKSPDQVTSLSSYPVLAMIPYNPSLDQGGNKK
ncbi:YveK family protein [Alkalibacter saccharofermentans]|uniref:Capsular polysaccharide biosynthesis protein n=1 Tax=Alkalibacter saccharofermentans DSM 14828 TaxID=1120975 RepID=A0A1M4ZUN4_9FIRM|nr:Wzz/FepE/Etk N-terminal domain-containing protein [Alkalibacter saccharofermentans]SHF21763.1 Capsular polysaccharide biosynthesis protein [Alkalibacter saccharofermentans DSM 14828]